MRRDPAFPTTEHGTHDGMTLLDYFAGQAMLGLVAASSNRDCEYTKEGYAEAAYEIAQAMLAARKEALK